MTARSRQDFTTLDRDEHAAPRAAVVRWGLSLDQERYEIGEVLGEGGMGEVHRCHDRLASRDVALKVIRSSGDIEDVEQRFLREARVQATLAHPAIVPVYNVDKDLAGRTYFTMKRVEGDSLSDVLERARDRRDHEALPGSLSLSRHRLLAAFLRVCLAVDYAHSRGVLHRDLKPANVMLGRFGEVYVLDWGLAKLRGADDDTLTPKHVRASTPGTTERGVAMGTPAYMAPEQAAALPIDERADVFALGAILFEIVTCEPLLGDEAVKALRERRAAAYDARPSVRARELGLPLELDTICVRATARDADERYPTARALHDAVEAFLSADEEETRRLRLAAQHRERAKELARPGAPDTMREAALGEIGAALALAPEDVETRRTFVDLLKTPFETTPEEVKQRQLQHETNRARRMQRLAAISYLVVWLVVYPICVVAGGARSWLAVLAVPIAWVATAGAIWNNYRQRRYARVAWAALLGSIALGTTSLIWGPFFIVPGLAVAMVFGHILVAPRSHRAQLVAMTCLALAVPAYLSWSGVVDVYTPIGDESFMVHGAIGVTRDVLYGGILASSLGVLGFGASFAHRFRDTLDKRVLEEALFSWQLTNLVSRARPDVRPLSRSFASQSEADTRTPKPARVTIPSTLDLHGDRYAEPKAVRVQTDAVSVVSCHDRQLGRDVEMHLSRGPLHDATVLKMASTRGRLEHPAIASLYDVGRRADGRAYFTLERLDGTTFADAIAMLDGIALLATRERERRRLLSALGQVCLAVAYTHERGVSHGAIDGDTILLGAFGEVHIEELDRLTRTGDASGVADDVRSLGALLRSLFVTAPMSSEQHPELMRISSLAMTSPSRTTARAIHEAIEAFLSHARNANVRQELACAHFELAVKAADRAGCLAAKPRETRSFAPGELAEAEASRAEALREVGMSVRLDPQHPEAVRLFLQLITQPPATPPPEVLLEVEEQRRVRARAPAVATLLFGLLWLLLFPAVVWVLGVRDLTPVIGVWLVWLLVELTIFLSLRYPGRSVDTKPWPLFATTIAAAITSVFSGPFFITPIVTIATMGFVLIVPRRWRKTSLLLGVAVVAVPMLLSWVGVLEATSISGAIVHSHGPVNLPSPRASYLVLESIDLLCVLFAAEYSSRFRDRLEAVEIASLTRAWQLTKLLSRSRDLGWAPMRSSKL